MNESICSPKSNISEWGLPPLIVAWFRNKGISSLFEWQVQCLCQDRVLTGRNLIYSAPTSAGKTLVADFLLLKKVFESRKKALIVEPFIALAREKATSLKSMLWSTKARVGSFCGSYYTPGGITAVNIAVCTIEKANNIVNKLINEDKLSDLGIIVVDEIHYLGDPSRGYLLELLLTKILYYNERSNSKIQIVGLSATIPNLKTIASWLNASLYVTEYRPVPLIEKIKIDKSIYDASEYLNNQSSKPLSSINLSKIPVTRDTDDICYICIDSIINGHSTLVFCESRRDCEVLALMLAEQILNLGRNIESKNPLEKTLATDLRKFLNSKKINDTMTKLKACPAGADLELSKPLKFGVAFHHAGLTSEEREIIEDGFRSGAIKVLMATSTLSSGVNLPAWRVVIKSPLFYNNRQKEMLEPMTYKQMVGRAGRKNIDTYGESILICRPETKEVALKLTAASLNHIVSALGNRMVNYDDVGKMNFDTPSSGLKKAILEVIANKTVKTKKDLDLYLGSTFWLSSHSVENRKNFDYLVIKTLNFLITKKFVEELKPGVYRATRLGTAVLASGLSPDESLELLSDLIRAREGFCLVNDLHIIYQITPSEIAKSIEIRDWLNYFNLWTDLDEICQYVGKRVGVDETVIARRSRGFMNALTIDEERIYRRFFIALAINDLVNEMALPKICSRYRISKAVVQQAQRATAQFAGVLTIFSEQLGYENIAALVKPLESRINFSCQRDLLDLIKLNISRPIARSLFNNGYKTVVHVAKGEALDLEFAIKQSRPFKKDSSFNEESKITLPTTMWVPELSKSMPVIEYAQHLVDTARSFIEIEFDLDFTQTQVKRRDSTLSLSVNLDDEEQNPPFNKNIDKRLKTTVEPAIVQPVITKLFDQSRKGTSTKNEVMPRRRNVEDIANFDTKYIKSDTSELKDFLDKWITHHSVSVNFKLESRYSSNLIGSRILNKKRSSCNKKTTQKTSYNDDKDDFEEDLTIKDDPDASEEDIGIPLQLDLDDNKQNITRLYACFDEELIVYIIKTPKALTYIKKNLYKWINKINQDEPLKLYTQDAVSSYKILHSGFDLEHRLLNERFEWHSFEVAWWLINDCPYRGINNQNVSLSMVSKTKWVPQYRHFLYSAIPRSASKRTKSEYFRLKDVVKSGKTAILQPLIEEILKELGKRKQLDAYFQAEIPSRLVMASMMIHGFGLNLKFISQELNLYRDILDQLTHITRECYASNKDLSLTNIKHVAEVLYKDLDLKHHLINQSTNSDISKDPTNSEVLKILEKYHPFARLVQDYRKIGKALEALQTVNTHSLLDGELDMQRVFGKCDFWQLTGRVSMSDPDLFLINRNFVVSIPPHQHRQKELIDCKPRRCFVPYDSWVIVAADYSQLELRLLAHFSNDENLLNILNNNISIVHDKYDDEDYEDQEDDNIEENLADVFKNVACKIYKVPINSVTSSQRQHAKQICYGLIYGMGDRSLGISLGVDVERARTFRQDFLSAFPKIELFVSDLLAQCRQTGYVESLLGRRRPVAYVNSDKIHSRARAERVAINTRIQASASDVIKLAMNEVNKIILNHFEDKVRMVLEMHDELIFEVEPSCVQRFSKLLKQAMENLDLVKNLKSRLFVNVKKGPNWASLEPFKT